jgi:hypothetical protein
MERINLIRNCLVRFRTVCPKTWDELSPTPAAEGVRFCGTCAREVFLCTSDADAVMHARAGHCIAKPAPDPRGLPHQVLRLGEPEEPEAQPTAEELLWMEEASLEKAKTYALQRAEHASRLCPGCGYPCADWWTTCHVCELDIGRAPAS